jgi:hypothetical protein
MPFPLCTLFLSCRTKSRHLSIGRAVESNKRFLHFGRNDTMPRGSLHQ